MDLRVTAAGFRLAGSAALLALLATGCSSEAKHTGRRPEGERRPLPELVQTPDGRMVPKSPVPTRTVETEPSRAVPIKPPESSFDDPYRR